MNAKQKQGTVRQVMVWVLAICLAMAFLMPDLSHAASGVKLGSRNTEFEPGTTYIVPISLKKATHPEDDSAAKACPGKYGKLTIASDGTATLDMETRGVTVGTITDFAYDFKVYQGNSISSNTADATVVETYTDQKSLNGNTVPKEISFTIPNAMTNKDGVYLSMSVDAMPFAPDAWLKIDYDKAVKSGDPSINYTKTGTALVSQFGKYNINVTTTVKDGKITNVAIEGTDFDGSKVDDNKRYLDRAINGTATTDEGGYDLSQTTGMKSRIEGLYDTDSDDLNGLDTVSGATYSSNTIKEAAMNALGIEIKREIIPDAPETVPDPGYYSIELKDRTAVVDHGLVGENVKAEGILRVDKNKKMYLSYKLVSGTVKEPLHVLAYNGYYKNNDTSSASNLTKSGVHYNTAQMIVPNMEKQNVVTDITRPLDVASPQQTYTDNVYLYVNAMRALGNPDVIDKSTGKPHEENETLSGVTFNRGRFNIDSTITLYWDTLTKISADSNDAVIASAENELSSAQKVTDQGYTSTSWNAFKAAKNTVSTLLAQGGKDKAKLQSAVKALKNAKAKLATTTIKGITYKASGKYAQVSTSSKNLKSASVAASVKIGKKTYKVTAIKAGAFRGQKKLKSVTIGKNVKTIGSKAFYGDKKLAKITFKGKAVKKIGSKAFKGIARKATFKAPKAKKNAYKKMIKKAGATKGFRIKVA